MKNRLLCAVIATAAVFNSAQAAPIVFDWQGTAIVALSQYGIAVGDNYTGTLSFDPDTVTMGAPRYEWSSASGKPALLTIKAGNLEQTLNVGISIANDYYGFFDQYSFSSVTSNMGYVDLYLQNPGPNAHSGFALPNASLDYTAYANRVLMINGREAASITSFAVPSIEGDVPEPATLGLTVLGLAAVGFARRRKPSA